MSIHRTGNAGSKPPSKPTQTDVVTQNQAPTPARNQDRFEGMTRPDLTPNWRHGETGLRQALESSSPSHEVLTHATDGTVDDALDEFNELFLQYLNH